MKWFFTIGLPVLGIVWLLAMVNAYKEKEKIIYNQAKELEQQRQQLEIKNEIIETKTKVFKRKEIAKSVSTSDNLKWLRQTHCKDCSD